MSEGKPGAKAPEEPQKPEDANDSEALSEDFSPPRLEPLHGIESHALSPREQIMRQWPSVDYEKRD